MWNNKKEINFGYIYNPLFIQTFELPSQWFGNTKNILKWFYQLKKSVRLVFVNICIVSCEWYFY